MAWSPEISQLSTDVTQLTDAVNVKKNELSTAVTSAQSSRITANSAAAAAESSVIPSTTNMQSANTHKNSVLSIYGTQAIQQSSLNIAAGQASAAAASAVAATAVLTQDLSGVTAQALHRSPNAITSMFVYDTSKDSDGGAWTEKCQHTSWYNEAIMSKWLGPQISETYARYSNATLGSELITNGNFSNGSTGWTLNGFSIVDGSAVSTSSSISIRQNVTTVAGKLYRVEYNAKLSASLVGSIVRLNSAGNLATTNVTGPTNAFGTVVEYVVAGSGTTGLEIITTAGSNIFSVDNVSLREVTALTTSSSDYFQLTTDGKFYQLWRNFLGMTERLTDAFWIKNIGGAFNNGGTGSRTITDNIAAHDGQLIASQVRESAFNEIQGVIPPGTSSTLLGFDHVFTIDLKADTRTQAFVGHIWDAFTTGTGQGSWIVIDLTNGTQVGKKEGLGNADSSLLSCISLGNGWYRATVRLINVTNSQQLRPVFGPASGGVGVYQGDGSSGILVARPHVEIGTTAAIYEKKSVAQGRLGEVFRGNKRDFPRLAGIVAEGANVNIYDLTEPGRPMWMRFMTNTSSTSMMALVNITSSFSSIAMREGSMIVGSGGSASGWIGTLVEFVSERIQYTTNGTPSSFVGNIASRNSALGRISYGGYGTLSGLQANAVAMTTLADAPTDPVTGLRVPTIALATSSGISIIKHNGTVVNSATTFLDTVTLTPYVITGSRGYSNADHYIAFNPGSLAAGFTFSSSYGNQFDNLGSTSRMIARGRSSFLKSNSNRVGLRWLNESMSVVGKHLSGVITPTHNTGWLPGDIRRVYLSDSTPGPAAANIQVENFSTYANDAAMKLVWNQGGGITGSLVNGKLQLAAAGGTAVGRSWPTTPGRVYSLSVTVATGVVAAIRLGATSYAVTYGQFSSIGVGTSSTVFTAVGTAFHAGTYGNAAGISEISNITLTEIEVDRSYKAKSASINGNIIKAQLAAGTSLVGYSGFSTANYIREPYSADLDFGTGEFSASAWVNIPATLPDSSFPAISTQLISGDAVLSGGATFSAGALTVSGTVGSNGYWLLSGHTPGKVYRVTFDVLELQSSGNSITIRTGVSGNAGLYSITYVTSLGKKILYFVATSGNAPAVTFVRSDPAVGQTRIGNVSVVEVSPALIADRAYSSGTKINLGINGAGQLTATVFDGTTSRTVTTTATYNTAQWVKAEANYTTDGSLGIRVNGREVAVTRGTPLGNITFGKNLLPYSNTLTTWTKFNSTVTNPSIITPDGTTQTVSLYKDSIGTTEQRVSYDIGVAYATQVITVSVYVKRIDSDYFSIQISEEFNYQNLRAAFNITDTGYGLVNTFGTVTTSITPAGNGWFRITVSGQSNNNNNTKVFFTLSSSVSGTSRVYAYSYTATGKSVYIYGAQAEVGSSATNFMATNAAPLTIGNSYAADAPFPGSIALLKLSATAPTPEQSIFMYEQEKQLLKSGALSVLPDTNAILDMSYDDATDRWSTITTANESYWNGLVRSSTAAVPSGGYSRITTTSGVKLTARISTNPGVDVSIPPYALREELVKRSETANQLVRKTVTYDFTGGFTGNITIGSTSILSVAGLVYPTSYIGARISGTGIPANTTITGISGTTIYISTPATATTTTLAITFLDFNLPVGMEAKVVLTAGVIKREGSTSDYTRLFDGFIETIRFAVAPGSTAWVQIQATRAKQ